MISKIKLRILHEFRDRMDESGCLDYESWVTGRGENRHHRIIPVFVKEYSRDKTMKMLIKDMTTCQKKAAVYFLNNSKAEKVLVFDQESYEKGIKNAE